jgi:hypothetical protein
VARAGALASFGIDLSAPHNFSQNNGVPNAVDGVTRQLGSRTTGVILHFGGPMNRRRHLFLLVALFSILRLPLLAETCGGQERWPVKVGSDGRAAAVDTCTFPLKSKVRPPMTL